jgi:hypothetical protein
MAVYFTNTGGYKMKQVSIKKVVLDLLIGIVLISGLVWLTNLHAEQQLAEQQIELAQSITVDHAISQFLP